MAGGERTTVAALASAPGRSGVAVFRITGPLSRAVLEAVTGRAAFEPRRAHRVLVCHPGTGEMLDEALALWFPGPASFTGEDVAEIQGHGGRAVTEAVLSAILSVTGVRLAGPGEFTRRAFDNGKLDLTAVEALADLIDADTAEQRRLALRQYGGELRAELEACRSGLLRALALLEAAIDFPDEDLPSEVLASARPILQAEADRIERLLAGGRGERLRDGMTVAIVGPPNAGKSTLMNALARRDVAIVSDRPGTTRDVLEVHLDLDGYPVTVLDTAGLREAEDAIEREGIERAKRRAAEADVRLHVIESGPRPLIADHGAPMRDGDAVIVNKVDLAPPPTDLDALRLRVFPLSASTGAGLADLTAWLGERARDLLGTLGSAVITRARHRQELEVAAASIRAALAVSDRMADLACEDVRRAAQAIGRITGAVNLEEVLDAIFAEFCLGK